jgi:predicted transcriptional regulator
MKELELTRDELRKSSEAQQKSEKALAEQVNQMEKTAKLNALSSLLDHHNAAIKAQNPEW